MPRKWIETIRPWPRLKRHQAYRCRVRDVQRSDAPQGMLIVLEHLDEPNVGRRHTIVLPLPMRPEGLAPEFFGACGQKIGEGVQIAPKEAVGKVVAVRFEDGNNIDATAVSFASPSEANTIPQETTHGDNAN